VDIYNQFVVLIDLVVFIFIAHEKRFRLPFNDGRGLYDTWYLLIIAVSGEKTEA